METIMIYEVNGKRFDDPQEALVYEKLCKEVLDTLKECIEYEEYAVEYECMGEDQLNRLKTIQEKLKKL